LNIAASPVAFERTESATALTGDALPAATALSHAASATRSAVVEVRLHVHARVTAESERLLTDDGLTLASDTLSTGSADVAAGATVEAVGGDRSALTAAFGLAGKATARAVDAALALFDAADNAARAAIAII
jgi:hypothetical protein